MKLTKPKLRQIIKEEFGKVLNENPEKMQALADELGGELKVDDNGQFIINVVVNIPPDPSGLPPQMDYEDGVIYTDYYFGEGEEDEDPRSSLGGMIDVDYEDPVVAPPARGLEEKELRESALTDDEMRDDLERWYEELDETIRAIDVGNADLNIGSTGEAKLIDALTSAAQFVATARELIPKQQQIGLEERTITKTELQEIIKQELSEALPPHLQSKVDAYEKKKQKFSITDRTPPGYGPDDEEEPLKLGTPEEDPMKRTRDGRGQASRLRKKVMNK